MALYKKLKTTFNCDKIIFEQFFFQCKNWRPRKGSNPNPFKSCPLPPRLDLHKQHTFPTFLHSHVSWKKQSKNATTSKVHVNLKHKTKKHTIINQSNWNKNQQRKRHIHKELTKFESCRVLNISKSHKKNSKGVGMYLQTLQIKTYLHYFLLSCIQVANWLQITMQTKSKLQHKNCINIKHQLHTFASHLIKPWLDFQMEMYQ